MPPREQVRPRLEELTRLLDAPPPGPGDPYASLRWLNRWIALLELLERAWEEDREEARERWMPEAAARVLPWPAAQRPLPRSWFDRVASGKDDGRAEVFGPLFAHLDLGLDRRSVRFEPRRFGRFFSHPIASCLRALEMRNTHLPPAMAHLVARSPRLGQLEYLSFDRTSAGTEGVRAIAAATHFTALRELDLYYVGMNDEGLRALLEAPFLPRLTALQIGGNELGSAGARALAACERLPSLRRLGFWVDRVDLAGALALLESPRLAGLEQLDLRQNPLDEADQEQLVRAARPGLTIFFQARPGWVSGEQPG